MTPSLLLQSFALFLYVSLYFPLSLLLSIIYLFIYLLVSIIYLFICSFLFPFFPIFICLFLFVLTRSLLPMLSFLFFFLTIYFPLVPFTQTIFVSFLIFCLVYLLSLFHLLFHSFVPHSHPFSTLPFFSLDSFPSLSIQRLPTFHPTPARISSRLFLPPTEAQPQQSISFFLSCPSSYKFHPLPSALQLILAQGN